MADSVRARCPVAQGAKRSELFQLVDQLKDFELPSDLEPWKPDERPSEPGRAAVVRDVVPSTVDSAEPPSEFDPTSAAASRGASGGIRPSARRAGDELDEGETSELDEGETSGHGTRA